jgi:2-oxoglutarate dehydrogenase E1 component
MNQGAWYSTRHRFQRVVAAWQPTIIDIRYAGRPASAAPACGSPYLHAKQQAALVADALNPAQLNSNKD